MLQMQGYVDIHMLIWSLSNIIPHRIIITSHKHISSITHNSCTSNSSSALPHNLSIMSTHLPLFTAVGGVGVVLLFISPRLYRVGRRPRSATAPVNVLPQLETVLRERMLQLA